MKALRLVPITETLLAERASTSRLESAIGASIDCNEDVLGPVLDQTESLLLIKPRPLEWGCYLTVDEELRQLIGTCGYKDKPDTDGAVEIAYFTFPAFEGRGYGTGMAAALVARAGARRVIAHTLPVRNASCRILEKSGFTFAGQVEDPEDGLVWRWEVEPG